MNKPDKPCDTIIAEIGLRYDGDISKISLESLEKRRGFKQCKQCVISHFDSENKFSMCATNSQMLGNLFQQMGSRQDLRTNTSQRYEPPTPQHMETFGVNAMVRDTKKKRHIRGSPVASYHPRLLSHRKERERR